MHLLFLPLCARAYMCVFPMMKQNKNHCFKIGMKKDNTSFPSACNNLQPITASSYPFFLRTFNFFLGPEVIYFSWLLPAIKSSLSPNMLVSNMLFLIISFLLIAQEGGRGKTQNILSGNLAFGPNYGSID